MIYVVDTNVLFEVMKDQPHSHVAAWLRARPLEAMCTTAISRSEIVYGIRRMPDGLRRGRLERAAQRMFDQEFDGRVLPFDARAADAYADIRIMRTQLGRPVATEDGMIAAIAKIHGAAVVTRDVGGFEACGITVINPWHEE